MRNKWGDNKILEVYRKIYENTNDLLLEMKSSVINTSDLPMLS